VAEDCTSSTMCDLLACHLGPTSFAGWLPVRADEGDMQNFTCDFSVQPSPSSFGNAVLRLIDHHCPYRKPDTSMPDAGFSIKLFENEINVFFRCPKSKSVRLTTDFNKNDKAGKWSRITITVETTPENIKAALYIDLTECDVVIMEPGQGYRPAPPSEQLMSGSSFYHGQIKNFQLLAGVLPVHGLPEARSFAEVRLARAHMQALGASLWSSPRFSDCTVQADDGSRWHGHRCVLAATSEVFSRMFESGLQEAQQNVPVITLRDAAAVDIEALLHCIYTGLLPGRQEEKKWSSTGVLSLAHMYEVHNLIPLLVQQVEQEVCPENIVETIRVMNKRKEVKPIGAAFKRIRQRVQNDNALAETVMDAM